MDRIKVLLAGGVQVPDDLLRDLIQSQEDMRVVGKVLSPVETLLTVKMAGADVVIITLPNGEAEPGIISHLLSEYPDLLVITVSPSSNLAYIYRRDVYREKLFNISNEDLLMAIRIVKE